MSLLHFLCFISLFALYAAYITDIKIIACEYECPQYPGYYMIPTDLNKGVANATPVFMLIKEDEEEEEPITDLLIMQGNNKTGIPHFNKWNKLNVNLNLLHDQVKSEENSLWLLYTKDTSISNNPITSIIVKEGSSPIVSAEYRRIPTDLNQNVGGYHLFMYYSQDGVKDPITAITAKECFTESCYIDGWERVEKDLNKGVIVGMSVFLFYKREKLENPVTDVIILLNNETAPQEYVKVDVNLNAVTIRGDQINLWYKKESNVKIDDSIQELAIEYGDNTITPFGWTKVDIDLNSADDGMDGFGEPTFLYFKKGYAALPVNQPLVFNEYGEFKILQLADLHLSNKQGVCHDIPVDMNCNGDNTTIDFVERLLDKENPDLVVFTGDNINSGGVTDARAATFKFAEPVIKRKIRWATTFGYYDDENELTKQELFEVMRRMPYSLTQRGQLDVPGVGNYRLKILSNATKSATHDFTLYFLDSNKYDDNEEMSYSSIQQEQLDWLTQLSDESNNASFKPKAMAFFHSPIREYQSEKGIQYSRLGDQREEIVNHPKNNIAALEAFKLGNVIVTSCGQNHVNDFCQERDSVQLCYGGGAGYGGYGASHLGWPRRARVFNIIENGKGVVTWKRLHDDDLSMLHFQTLFREDLKTVHLSL